MIERSQRCLHLKPTSERRNKTDCVWIHVGSKTENSMAGDRDHSTQAPVQIAWFDCLLLTQRQKTFRGYTAAADVSCKDALI
jgi:hypothetical protein